MSKKRLTRIGMLSSDEHTSHKIYEVLSGSPSLQPSLIPVQDAEALVDAASHGEYDVCVADVSACGEQYRFIHRMRARARNIPVIVILNQDNIELGMEILTAGAFDYILPHEVSDGTLVHVVRRGHEQKELAKLRLVISSETPSYEDRLAALHHVINQLVRVETIEQLCHDAVELGRAHLGFERLGVWLREDDGSLRGTFGIDIDGNVRDEREQHRKPEPGTLVADALVSNTSLVISDDLQMEEWDGTWLDCQRMVTTLCDGTHVFGILGADNAISKRPLDQKDGNILGIYATTLAHLVQVKRTEAALRDGETKFRRMFASSTDVFFEADLQANRPLYYSSAVESVTGYTSDELTALGFDVIFSMIHEEDRERIAALITNVAESRTLDTDLKQFDYRWRRKDGRYIWLTASASVVFDESRHAPLLVGTFRDVTTQKKHAEALQDAHNELERRVQERTHELQTANAELRMLRDAEHYFSRQLTRLFEVVHGLALTGSSDELLREGIRRGRMDLGFERLSIWLRDEQANGIVGTYGIDEHGEVRDERDSFLPMDERIERLLKVRGDSFVNIEAKSHLYDQKAHVIGTGEIASATLWDGRNALGFMAADNYFTQMHFSKEQTEILSIYATAIAHLYTVKKSDEALRRSENTLRTLIDANEEITVLIDREGRVLACNEALARPLRQSVDEVVGQNLFELLPPPLAEQRRKEVQELMTRERPMHGTSKIFGRSYEQSFYPVFDSGNNLAQIAIIVRDVTEQKRNEKIFAEQRMKMIASSRLSSLGVMASGVAHEINNPLATISVAADQLKMLSKRGPITPKQGAKLGNTIFSSAERIRLIIRGLRGLSRDGTQDPAEPAKVMEIINEALDVCRTRFRDQGIRLDVDEIPASLEVECRRVQIAQILINLLNNAFDAVEGLQDRWVRVGAREFGGSVLIKVEDSGSGVPEPLRDKILDPFFTTKEVGKGVGLGLSISRSIANSHNGELFLDPECPHTRFVIRLPQKQGSGAISTN